MVTGVGVRPSGFAPSFAVDEDWSCEGQGQGQAPGHR